MTDDEAKRYEAFSGEAVEEFGISEELLRTRYVFDRERYLYDRVRRDQVRPQHTHYWCDRKQRWINLKTLQPEER